MFRRLGRPINLPFGGQKTKLYDAFDPNDRVFRLSDLPKVTIGQMSQLQDNVTEGMIEKLEEIDRRMGEQIILQQRASQIQLSIAQKAEQMIGIEADHKTKAIEIKQAAQTRELAFNDNVKGYIGEKKNYLSSMQETMKLLKGGT